jgi:competence ComEA-like helix-hairpin-helix protein
MEMAPRGININSAPPEQLAELPGIGEVRGSDIVRYREEHGPYRSIYDLGNVPGIGPSLFRRCTGLSLTSHTNRHAVLNGLLDLEPEGRHVLSQIAHGMMQVVSSVGCVLTSREGISLATAGTVGADAVRYAALGSRFFFRTQRYLKRFVAQDSDCLILPGCRPPLLLLAADDIVLILTMRSSLVSRRRLARARRAVREVGWLMSPRAVVINI